MRLFIAINFNNETRKRLLALRNELRSQAAHGRFSPPENLHLTLVFIGEYSPKHLEKFEAILETVTFAPFTLSIDRIGTFARGGNAIWWAGVRADEPLMELQHEIEHKLALCGYEMDGRKYKPHITLGREVSTDQLPWRIEPFGETVTGIHLMQSERLNGKLIYTPVFERHADSK